MAVFVRLLLALTFAVAALTAGRAEDFPSHPVHILVPYPAGGAVDVVSRTLGDELSRMWGQPVVIDNKPGAGGVVASQALVTSPKDGYTLIVVASGHATNPFLYNCLLYTSPSPRDS